MQRLVGMDKAALSLCWALVGCAGTTTQAPPSLTSALSTHAPASGERALDLYGRARAFELNGQCVEAQSVYEEYADAVRGYDSRSAEMALSYASQCRPHADRDSALSFATRAILARDDRRALALLDGDTSASPWVQYNRGVVLADLHRTDEAAAAFDAARDAFHDKGDRGMAIYGKARAYHDALRCGDAVSAYREYVAIAQPVDAELALAYARDCIKHAW
jgi:tetratricopeptide (TPR) repeat protein